MATKINLDYRVKGNENIYDDVAKEWANEIKDTKKTQVRNFYDKVLELVSKSKKEEWSDLLPFVKMLNSKVAYGVSRKVLSSEFQDMMTQCISQIKDKEDLERFKIFFEAVLGFFKGTK